MKKLIIDPIQVYTNNPGTPLNLNKIYKATSYDLPQCNGDETLKSLRTFTPQNSDFKVFVIPNDNTEWGIIQVCKGNM